MNTYFAGHTHTDRSNFRLRDAINKPSELLDHVNKLGLRGVAVTDHETVASHATAYQHFIENRDQFPEDFTLAFGNEIYLVDRSQVEYARENNEKISFHHFILIAKNEHGHEGLRKLSSLAWKNSFFFRGMERVPTYKDDLERIMKDYKGDIIATSACVGGELPQLLIKYYEDRSEENKKAVTDFASFLKYLFGDDLYFELQPSKNRDQLIANEMLLKIADSFDVKCTVSTDAHYLSKDQAKAHEMYLRSTDGDREVAEFYSTTYVFSYDELLEYFKPELLEMLAKNTLIMADSIEEYGFAQETQIPLATVPDYEMHDYIHVINPEKYPHIINMSKSENEIDRYYCHLVLLGLSQKNEELNDINLSRIDIEFSEVEAISYQLNQPMSSYFVLMKDLVDIMWEVSLVGVSRGSASCFYTNYLLDIVQINAIKFDLPHWRFLSKERVELPDIDVDSEGSRRFEIVQLVKERYGEDNVLNIGTYTTEGVRQSVLTACRGFGIDKDEAHNIANLLPNDKGVEWPIKDAFEGNPDKGRKPAKSFLHEISKYDGLKETLMTIQGVVSGRGQHASGLVVFPDGFVAQNAMMRTSGKLPITQYDANDTSYMGGLKYDFLSINALDRIRLSMELLLKDNKIEWQGTLKDTYNKYFHPDVCDMDSPEMYQMLMDGHVINAFQFETPVGRQTLEKIEAKTFDELAAANSLMRLTTDGEQPIDRFIRYKNNIADWYIDMEEGNLTKEEKQELIDVLGSRYGVCDTQEALMILAMSPLVSGYGLGEANRLRKSVAKQDEAKLEKEMILFYEAGEELGSSKQMLDYVWHKCFKPTFGYAFSLPHIAGYTLELIIEMNICYRYGPIFWKTACLSIAAGMIGEEEKGTDYSALAKALGRFRAEITPPSINKSELGFVPDLVNEKILYGLKPITGLNATDAQFIIDNRPYKNVKDFHSKCVIGGPLSDSKLIVLIKSGAFDEFNPDRRDLMIKYIRYITPLKQKLTASNIQKLTRFLSDKKFDKALEAFEFGKSLPKGKEPKLDEDQIAVFREKYLPHLDKYQTKKYNWNYKFGDNGEFIINEAVFTKYKKVLMEPITEWLKTTEALVCEAKLRMEESWKKYAQGNTASWEMQSISFYIHEHELEFVPLDNYFEIAKFSEMPTEPNVAEWKYNRNGTKRPIYQTYAIAGTVVEKTKGKGLITIVTEDAVVLARIGKGKMPHYDKSISVGEGKDKVVIDPSWFVRGTKLVLIGYRRGNEFVGNKFGSNYQHSVMKIGRYNKDEVEIQLEKKY